MDSREKATPETSTDSNLEFDFCARISGSENHKGFNLYLETDRIGEILPLDEDGKEGLRIAKEMIKRLNGYPALLSEVKGLREAAKLMRETIRNRYVHELSKSWLRKINHLMGDDKQ